MVARAQEILNSRSSRKEATSQPRPCRRVADGARAPFQSVLALRLSSAGARRGVQPWGGRPARPICKLKRTNTDLDLTEPIAHFEGILKQLPLVKQPQHLV